VFTHRAALLTGRNHTHVGAGQIAEFANDFDGYVGEIPRSAATVARVLSEYGYNSAAFGKWHNTPPSDVKPGGPYDQYPTGLGFRYFYGFIAGETSQYEPRLFENVNPVEPPHDPEYHLTEDLAERAKTFIRNHLAYTPDDPFFLYFAPGAVHGPHHIFKEWADKYKGKFDQGWEALREETFKRQKELGWIPEDAELTPMDESMQRWDDVPEEQRAFQTRLMEVYAGFLEHTDAQYGKVVDELEAQGLLENTLIIYINSDNGASAEGMNGTISELLAQNSMFSTVEEQMDVLARDYGGLELDRWSPLGEYVPPRLGLGGRYAVQEHQVDRCPFWRHAHPLCDPLAARHSGRPDTTLPVPPRDRHCPHPVRGGRDHPTAQCGRLRANAFGWRFDGLQFQCAEAPEQKRPQFFDIMGSRGIYQDGWFAAAFGPKKPWSTDISGF
jgi:arylsulfatase A-like enzyme